jgi:hypothetical protein
MEDYVDVSSFVANYDRSEANQAALRGDVIGDDDDRLIDGDTGDNDTE